MICFYSVFKLLLWKVPVGSCSNNFPLIDHAFVQEPWLVDSLHMCGLNVLSEWWAAREVLWRVVVSLNVVKLSLSKEWHIHIMFVFIVPRADLCLPISALYILKACINVVSIQCCQWQLYPWDRALKKHKFSCMVVAFKHTCAKVNRITDIFLTPPLCDRKIQYWSYMKSCCMYVRCCIV